MFCNRTESEILRLAQMQYECCTYSEKPQQTEFVRNQGIDCSGLVYYTLTHLGFKTAGFSWNNPVPVDSAHWLSVNSDCTITYGDVTTKVDVEKMSLPTPADSDAAATVAVASTGVLNPTALRALSSITMWTARAAVPLNVQPSESRSAR